MKGGCINLEGTSNIVNSKALTIRWKTKNQLPFSMIKRREGVNIPSGLGPFF